jgi:hypothetical protein
MVKRKVNKEMSGFVGWIAIMIGTWMITATFRDLVATYFVGDGGIAISLFIGFIFIFFAVLFFGKDKPWEK